MSERREHPQLYSLPQRLFALAYGIICHASFAAAVLLMGYETFFGFSRGVLPLETPLGRWMNLLLLLQFPLFHSLLLSKRGRGWLTKLTPLGLGADLATTTFALIASWQLILVFGLWVPSTSVWFDPHGTTRVVMALLFAASWLLLGKAISDASVALHSGFLGWGAVVRDQRPTFRSPAERGTFRIIRQPIYAAFALILFTGPVWTADHLWFALIWGSYCFIGPLFKERRLISWYGESYRDYQQRVPYMVPRLLSPLRKSQPARVAPYSLPAGPSKN